MNTSRERINYEFNEQFYLLNRTTSFACELEASLFNDTVVTKTLFRDKIFWQFALNYYNIIRALLCRGVPIIFIHGLLNTLNGNIISPSNFHCAKFHSVGHKISQLRRYVSRRILVVFACVYCLYVAKLYVLRYHNEGFRGARGKGSVFLN